MIKWLFSVLKCQKYKFETFNWKLIRTSSVHKWFQSGQSGICEEKYEKQFCHKIPLSSAVNSGLLFTVKIVQNFA